MVTEGRREDVLELADSPNAYQDRMVQLQHFRKNRTFCDVVLQVGSAEIYAHRSVLACASLYFLELFTTEDENKSASEDKLIYRLNGGFEKESVERLVTYAYTGQLNVPSALVKSVFIAANKLKMEKIVSACGEHLVETLSPETCLGIRALPRIAANTNLVERIDQYIQQQADLLQVTEDTMGVAKVLLKVIHASQDEASITTRALCSLALDWLRKEIEEEESTIDLLTEKEHLLYLNLDNSLHDCSDIQAGASNDIELVQDYRKISRKTSYNSIKIPRRKMSACVQPAKPRMMLFSRSISDKDDQILDRDWRLIAFSKPAERSVIAVVTVGGPVAVLSIQQHLSAPSSEDTIESRPSSVEKVDSYTLVSHMKSSRCASGTGTFSGQLLVCGGYDREECLSEVELYNPTSNTWLRLPEMRQNRGRFDLTVLDDKAYAVGGCNGTKELASVEVFNIETTQWSYVASLPRARSNAAVCSLDRKIFCVGGWNGQTGIKRCDVYNPKTNTWTTVAPLHIGRYQAAVVAMNGKVYVVGGCDSWNCLSSLEVYDPEQDCWRHLAPLNTPRRGCGASVLNGKLYVVGGSDGAHSLCSTEIYDPETNTWSAGPAMTSCRANVGATVVGKRIYAVGGFSGKIFLNSIEFLDPKTQEWTNFTPKPEYLVKQEECLLREEFSDEEIQQIKNPALVQPMTQRLLLQNA